MRRAYLDPVFSAREAVLGRVAMAAILAAVFVLLTVFVTWAWSG